MEIKELLWEILPMVKNPCITGYTSTLINDI